MNFRVGIGYDVHKLTSGEFIFLGGVKIPHNYTTVAHSDGDVLLHAICDALLGAAALGDIGVHFPNSDDKYRNISSLILLNKTAELLHNAGFEPYNIDATIIAEKPKIADYANRMIENISQTLKIKNNQINIKATTNEKIGFIGRSEGIAAIAVATIRLLP